MELSQANQRDLQILMNCKGIRYCQYSNCPVYNPYTGECDYKGLLLILSTKMYEQFEKEENKPQQGELVN